MFIYPSKCIILSKSPQCFENCVFRATRNRKNMTMDCKQTHTPVASKWLKAKSLRAWTQDNGSKQFWEVWLLKSTYLVFFCCIFWRKTSNHEVLSGAIPILDISMLCSAGDWIRPQTNPKAAPQPQFRGWWKRKKYRRIAERISVVEEQTLNEAKFLLAQRKEEEIQEFLCHEKISIIRWHRDKRTASLATSETHGFTALWKCRTQPYFGWRHSQSCRRYLDLAVQIHAMSVLLKPFDPSSLPLLHCNITQLIRITSLRITKKIYNLLPHIWEGLLTGFQSQIFTNTLLDTSPPPPAP